MRIDSNLTDEAVLAELGSRLAGARLERNLTQRQLGDAAGVDRLAIQHIEAGRAVKVTGLIRILRALGMLDALEQLLPERTPGPIEQLKLHGRRRRRASGAHSAQTPKPQPPGPWRWGTKTREQPCTSSPHGAGTTPEQCRRSPPLGQSHRRRVFA